MLRGTDKVLADGQGGIRSKWPLGVQFVKMRKVRDEAMMFICCRRIWYTAGNETCESKIEVSESPPCPLCPVLPVVAQAVKGG